MTLDAETLKVEMIRMFKLIEELSDNPEMLEKLPMRSKLVYRGEKRMFIPTTKNGKTLVL